MVQRRTVIALVLVVCGMAVRCSSPTCVVATAGTRSRARHEFTRRRTTACLYTTVQCPRTWPLAELSQQAWCRGRRTVRTTAQDLPFCTAAASPPRLLPIYTRWAATHADASQSSSAARRHSAALRPSTRQLHAVGLCGLGTAWAGGLVQVPSVKLIVEGEEVAVGVERLQRAHQLGQRIGGGVDKGP